MMKRILSVLAALMLLFTCASAETAAEGGRFESRKFVIYMGGINYVYNTDGGFPLWFAEGAEDLPYVDLEDWASLMVDIMTDGGNIPGYELYVRTEENGNKVVLARENGYTAAFDFTAGTIVFNDYIAFTGMYKSAYLAIADLSGYGGGQPFLLKAASSRERYGDLTVLQLKEYGIPMIMQDGKHLIPLQTLSSFFLSPHQFGFWFNGEAMFYSDIDSMVDPEEQIVDKLWQTEYMTEELKELYRSYDGALEKRNAYILDLVCESSGMGEVIRGQLEEMKASSLYVLYASAPKKERSQALISYGYNELCLELDCMYGLKEAHSIRDFDLCFLQTGLYDDLNSPDAAAADRAIAQLTQYWLDDSHSGMISGSWLAGYKPEAESGYSSQMMNQRGNAAQYVRSLYPDATRAYWEVGDTAYVTFDEFMVSFDEEKGGLQDYYAFPDVESLPQDTIGLIVYAHSQITRENSPIQNGVLDLSCNGGGTTLTAAFVLCWFLGEAHTSIHNTFTDAQSTTVFLADINLDRKFDDSDTLAGRGLNLYCLISPNSFSCANLVPWAFKEDGSVTLLGKVSGGGSCLVRPMTTAWGTCYQISGPERMAFVKNGSYYDVDRGVEPDHIIDKYVHFYDREALTEFIHGLY